MRMTQAIDRRDVAERVAGLHEAEDHLLAIGRVRAT